MKKHLLVLLLLAAGFTARADVTVTTTVVPDLPHNPDTLAAEFPGVAIARLDRVGKTWTLITAWEPSPEQLAALKTLLEAGRTEE